MLKTAYNSTNSPVVVHADGSVLGGGEWGTVETTDEAVKAAVEAGSLVLSDRPGRGVDVAPEAQAAFDRTDELASRSSAFGALEREELFASAVSAGLYDADDDTPTKTELVDRLTRSSVDAPAKPSGGGRRAAQPDKSEEN